MSELKYFKPSRVCRRLADIVLEKTDRVFWVEGQVINCRQNNAYYWRVEVADVGTDEVTYSTPRLRLDVPMREFRAVVDSDNLESGSIVRVSGQVVVWTSMGQFNLRVQKLELVGKGSPEDELEELRRVIKQHGLGANKPPLSLFLRHGVLVSPKGTNEGDLTEDLREGDAPYVPHFVHVRAPGDGPALAGSLTEAASRYPDTDAFIFGRGGTIDEVSAWDREPVLRAVDEVQRRGTPVVVAVGHPEHRPLVYEVAATTYRSMAVAGVELARHNRGNAERIRSLPGNRATFQNQVQSLRAEVEHTRSATGDELRDRTDRYRQRLSEVESQFRAGLERVLAESRDQFDKVATTGSHLLRSRVHELQVRTSTLADTLQGLRMGFALVESADGRHLSEGISVGETIRFEQPDVQGTATVTTIQYRNRVQEDAA